MVCKVLFARNSPIFQKKYGREVEEYGDKQLQSVMLFKQTQKIDFSFVTQSITIMHFSLGTSHLPLLHLFHFDYRQCFIKNSLKRILSSQNSFFIMSGSVCLHDRPFFILYFQLLWNLKFLWVKSQKY